MRAKNDASGFASAAGVQRRAVAMTPREQQIVELVALGHDTKQIASILGIASATVDSRIQGLYRKYAVNRRAALVWTALVVQTNTAIGSKGLARAQGSRQPSETNPPPADRRQTSDARLSGRRPRRVV